MDNAERERRYWARQKMMESPEAVDLMLEIHDLGADPLAGLRAYRDAVKAKQGQGQPRVRDMVRELQRLMAAKYCGTKDKKDT